MMVELKFEHGIDKRVLTPFGEEGIVTMLGFDDGGKHYYVKTKLTSSWYKEGDVTYLPVLCAEEEVSASAELEYQHSYRIGEHVTVYDRFRFAIPLTGIVASLSGSNDGVEVALFQSNSKEYPIGCAVWVHECQLAIRKPNE